MIERAHVEVGENAKLHLSEAESARRLRPRAIVGFCNRARLSALRTQRHAGLDNRS